MAKNYSLTEAVQIIVENEDAAQLVELGKRFPLLVSKITRIAAKAGEELNDLMQFIPENLSANKVNQSIKRTLEEGDEEADDEFEDDADDAEDEAPVKAAKGGKDKKKPTKTTDDEEDAGDTDYDSWNNAKMYKLLGEMGKRKDCKEKYGDLSHASMVKYLKKYGPGMEEAADDADAEVEDEEQNSCEYDDMSAVELYKLCKERKVKAEPKKPAKYYITLLKKADEAAAQAEDDAEDDEDWDDEEEVEEVPAPSKKSNKTNAKSTTKGNAKPAKKKEKEEDEDWDI